MIKDGCIVDTPGRRALSERWRGWVGRRWVEKFWSCRCEPGYGTWQVRMGPNHLIMHCIHCNAAREANFLLDLEAYRGSPYATAIDFDKALAIEKELLALLD